MVCPITRACFRELNRAYFVKEGFLYEDLADQWAELGEEIQRDDPSQQALRLRAFYLVEVIHHNFIIDRPKDYGASANSRTDGLLYHQYERSSSGLTKLVEYCNAEFTSLTIDQGELQLLSEDANGHTWKLVAARIDQPKFMLTACANAAVQLREYLAGGQGSLGTIGHIFAIVLQKGSVGPTKASGYLRTLLKTNIHNPTSPFNQVDL